MAENVVDELVVQLRLDAEQYRKAEATVERSVDRTDRKMQQRVRTTERRDKDQQRRLRDIGAGVKAFSVLATAAVGAVAALGTTAGVAITNLLGFQTTMRRQAVGTALSNREMQAWSATARRLGADANAGAEAVAALARERQQFELTGTAPTMQALARMGVNVERGRPIEDVLSDAQRMYRAAPAGQQQQFENTLAAQGVSADLILMIKSEIDARDSYTRSFGQASEENREALDALSDSLESIKSQAIAVSSTLLTVLMPAIQRGAEWLGTMATEVAAFANDVTEAGGGIRAFQTELEKRIPAVGTAINETRNQAGRFSDSVALTTAALDWLREKFTGFNTWAEGLLDRVRTPWRTDGTSIRQSLHEAREGLRERLGLSPGSSNATPMQRFRELDQVLDRGNRGAVNWARTRNEQRDGTWGRIKPLDESGASGAPGASGGWSAVTSGDSMSIMQTLVSQYGKTPAQAAAIVANWNRESGLRANAYNPAGGGDGARGLAQWRGARSRAFQDRYGVKPDQASIDQQIEFAMTDPYERGLMMKALGTGGGANGMGVGYSRIYEAHGNVAEDLRRGREAAVLERNYGAQQTAAGTNISIQNMTVQTPDAGGFVGGLQRVSGSQNYNSVQR